MTATLSPASSAMRAMLERGEDSSPTLRDHAVALARRGFRVFPLGAGSKVPRDKGWPEIAMSDPDEVARLWSCPVTGLPQPYNVGVLTGEGVVGIDVDVKAGKPGMASLTVLALPGDTMIVRTASGGLHYLFKTDRDFANVVDSDKSPSPLGRGIDVRGHHGYLVGPGSVVDGKPYVIEHDAPLAMLPAAIADRLTAPRGRAERTASVIEPDTPFALDRAATYLRDEAPVAIEGQGGDDCTYRVACVVRDMGLSEPAAFDVMAEHYNPRCCPPWNLDELQRKVENAFAYALAAAGGQSPTVDLAGIAIVPPRYVQPQRASLQWADDPGSDQPIRWLIKGILPRNGVGIIYGAPKSGKSFVAFDLSARLAAGLPWFNVRTPKERIGALLLLGEGAGTVRTRLQAFRLATGADFPPLAWASVANLSTAAGLAAAREIIADAAAGMASRGLRLGMIVVDTLASALGLEDENSAPEVTAALKALEAVAAEFDVAVLGIHHAGKNGQDRGSSAFRAACDVMLAVERSEPVAGQANNHRQISVVLNRNGEGDWSANFTLDHVVLGVDEDGDEITSCTVRPAGAAPAAINRREIVMGQFDPCTIHLHGDRLSGDRWGMTRRALRERCARQWDHLSADAVKKAVQRCVAELLENGRLREEIVDGDAYLVAVPQVIGGQDAPASLF